MLLSRGSQPWASREKQLWLMFVLLEQKNWLYIICSSKVHKECDYLRALAKPRLQVSTVVDAKTGKFNLKRGGQRVATMLMYLTDNVEGVETFFPMAGSDECSCGGKMVKALCVKPNKGDAVLFWSMGLKGESDPDSIHGGCEVLSGEKWSATKWNTHLAKNYLQFVGVV